MHQTRYRTRPQRSRGSQIISEELKDKFAVVTGPAAGIGMATGSVRQTQVEHGINHPKCDRRSEDAPAETLDEGLGSGCEYDSGRQVDELKKQIDAQHPTELIRGHRILEQCRPHDGSVEEPPKPDHQPETANRIAWSQKESHCGAAERNER